MNRVDFSSFDARKPYGPQLAEALRRQDCGDVPLTAVAGARSIGERVKAFRARLAPDSPLQSVAFQTAAMCGEIEAAASAASARVTLPRADDRAGDFYYSSYAADCRRLMRQWIAQEFAKVPNGVEQTAEQWYAETCATAEMNRTPNAHEKRLIRECVRDLSVAREAMDRERELQREVL